MKIRPSSSADQNQVTEQSHSLDHVAESQAAPEESRGLPLREYFLRFSVNLQGGGYTNRLLAENSPPVCDTVCDGILCDTICDEISCDTVCDTVCDGILCDSICDGIVCDSIVCDAVVCDSNVCDGICASVCDGICDNICDGIV